MDKTDIIAENTTIGYSSAVAAAVYLSVDEMAKLLSIARVTAYQLTKTQGFPCFYIGKRIIIPLQSLNEWAAQQALSRNVLIER